MDKRSSTYEPPPPPVTSAIIFITSLRSDRDLATEIHEVFPFILFTLLF